MTDLPEMYLFYFYLFLKYIKALQTVKRAPFLFQIALLATKTHFYQIIFVFKFVLLDIMQILLLDYAYNVNIFS